MAICAFFSGGVMLSGKAPYKLWRSSRGVVVFVFHGEQRAFLDFLGINRAPSPPQTMRGSMRLLNMIYFSAWGFCCEFPLGV